MQTDSGRRELVREHHRPEERQTQTQVRMCPPNRHGHTEAGYHNRERPAQLLRKKIRRIRGRYFRLRRSVGKARIIRKWRHKERETVKHEVHMITRRIVDKAKQTNAIIAVGDLKGIRRNSKRGSFNRRLSSQPFYLFKQCLTYKANWEGIRVLTVPEAYTSQTCHRS